MPEIPSRVRGVTGKEHGDVAATRAAHDLIKALPAELLDQHLVDVVPWPEAACWSGQCRTCASTVLVPCPELAEVAA